MPQQAWGNRWGQRERRRAKQRGTRGGSLGGDQAGQQGRGLGGQGPLTPAGGYYRRPALSEWLGPSTGPRHRGAKLICVSESLAAAPSARAAEGFLRTRRPWNGTPGSPLRPQGCGARLSPSLLPARGPAAQGGPALGSGTCPVHLPSTDPPLSARAPCLQGVTSPRGNFLGERVNFRFPEMQSWLPVLIEKSGGTFFALSLLNVRTFFLPLTWCDWRCSPGRTVQVGWRGAEAPGQVRHRGR